jgi:hypothetical protein
MKMLKTMFGALGLIVPLALMGTAASAEDQLKVAIGQINNWENQAPTLGQDAGIFKMQARPSRRSSRARPISAPASARPA